MKTSAKKAKSYTTFFLNNDHLDLNGVRVKLPDVSNFKCSDVVGIYYQDYLSDDRCGLRSTKRSEDVDDNGYLVVYKNPHDNYMVANFNILNNIDAIYSLESINDDVYDFATDYSKSKWFIGLLFNVDKDQQEQHIQVTEVMDLLGVSQNTLLNQALAKTNKSI